MMNLGLTRWDPFRRTSLFPTLSAPEYGFPSLFHEFFRSPLLGLEENDALRGGRWHPAVDVCEETDRVLVTAELPGFTHDQIKIEIEGNVLTISGERKLEDEKSDRSYSRMERSYGSFTRSFTLSSAVDRDKIHATFENGLLTVELPKTQESKPRQIPIEGGKKSSQKSIAA
ncbi:MAG TPA: Hsp20/alpha crystallin family protein [Thermoanaerobaculia bacterium]|nr:Hsp20/alpha crystallin family protein [Thermoanaerobaculia bacterium]